MRERSLLLALLLVFTADTGFANSLYAGIGWESSRELGGFTSQPPGGLVTVDLGALGVPTAPSGASSSPGGTTLVADVFTNPGDGYLTGLAFGASGALYASTCDSGFCPDTTSTSQLLQIDVDTGTTITLGTINDGLEDIEIYDLAFNPTNSMLYGISTDGSCFSCLYTIDTTNAQASLVGAVAIGFGSPGGIAFAADGTLFLTTTIPTTGFAGLQSLLTLDAVTGATLASEDVLLEQQFIFMGGGSSFLIESVPLNGLAIDPATGRMLATGENGILTVYERVFASVLDPGGTPISGPQWVWRVLGDSGENLQDLAFLPIPEPTTAILLGLAVSGMARRRNL